MWLYLTVYRKNVVDALTYNYKVEILFFFFSSSTELAIRTQSIL
jgi:hypothetical protein